VGNIVMGVGYGVAPPQAARKTVQMKYVNAILIFMCLQQVPNETVEKLNWEKRRCNQPKRRDSSLLIALSLSSH